MRLPPLCLLAVVALPCLLVSCGDLDVTRAAKPCTIIRYGIPTGQVFEMRVKEHMDEVLNNIKTGISDGEFIRLGESAYLTTRATVLAIEGC